MLHSEILASNNFHKNWKFVPWIGEQPYIETLFWHFSNMTIYIRVYGKMQDQHLKVLLFSIPGGQGPNSC